MDSGGDRLGYHVEVSVCVLRGDESVGEFYSVAVTNNCQQADTGTKDDSYREKLPNNHWREGYFGGKSQNSYRGLVKVWRILKTAVTNAV